MTNIWTKARLPTQEERQEALAMETMKQAQAGIRYVYGDEAVARAESMGKPLIILPDGRPEDNGSILKAIVVVGGQGRYELGKADTHADIVLIPVDDRDARIAINKSSGDYDTHYRSPWDPKKITPGLSCGCQYVTEASIKGSLSGLCKTFAGEDTIPLSSSRDDKLEAGLLIVIPRYAGQDQSIIPFAPDDFFWVTKASPVY